MVRIFCLSSFHSISPLKNVTEITPYEEDAVEKWEFMNPNELKTPERIKKGIGSESIDFEFYQLTEICIGYLRAKERKVYGMIIYRTDSEVLFIKMIRGAVKFNEISSNVFELLVATSKLFPMDLDFDLQIRLRCIKNTEDRGALNKDQKEAYENYAKKIKDFCSREVDGSLYIFPEIREKAFEYFPFEELSNQSTKKVFKQRITDLKNIIDFLCDPINGSFKRVPNDERCNQQLICLSIRENTWKINQPRKNTLSQQAKFHNDCKYLFIKNANFNKLELQNVDFESLISVQFINVEMFTLEMELHPFLRNVHFKNLVNLELVSCNIRKLPDLFFYLLPKTVKHLCLIKNDITNISEKISKLKNLCELNLRGNCNLGDDGIPWNFLPRNLVKLVLRETNITKIPEEIRCLQGLRILRVSSPQLKYIAWESIGCIINEIVVDAGNNKLNDLCLSEYLTRLHELHICNAGINRLNYALLQKLYSNYSTNVFGETPLIALNFANNNLKIIEWKLLPSNLQWISFDHNHLTSIEDISQITDLTYFLADSNQFITISDDICKLEKLNYINLKNNQLDRLPNGFENLNNLDYLDLSNNKFTYKAESFNEFLWSRLPHNLKTLLLNGNTLRKLPCSLRNSDILLLSANDCKLSHICPYLYAKKELQNSYWRLNIEQNPIEFLPFVPQTIFQDPSPAKKPGTENIGSTRFELTTNREGFIFGKVFPKKLKKPIYDFKICEGVNECHCCGNCGRQTRENMVQQIMVMDFRLELKNVLKISKKKYLLKAKEILLCENADTIETNSEVETAEKILAESLSETHYIDTKPKYYEPGQWKTIVKTRLCAECLKIIKKKTDDAFEEFKNGSIDNLIKSKKNKIEVKNIDDKDIKDQNVYHQTFDNKNIAESNISSSVGSFQFSNDNTLLSTYGNELHSNYKSLNGAVFQPANYNYPLNSFTECYNVAGSTIFNNTNNITQQKQQQKITELMDPPLPPSFDILLLVNPNGVDCFLNAAVNVIDDMKEVKNLICQNAKFYSVKLPQLQLAKILQRQINNVQALRQTLPLFLDNKQEDAAAALFSLLSYMDYQTQALFCYSYDTIRSCRCKSEIRTATQCSTLHLTIGQELNSVATFDSMLSNWSKYQSGQCAICGFNIQKEHNVKLGSCQKYLVVEINALVNMNNSMHYRSIPLTNFNEEYQSIFGAFWRLTAAIQYTGNINQGHYLTWRKCENAWNVISDDKYWHCNQLNQDLKHYRILVFQKINKQQQANIYHHDVVNEPIYITHSTTNYQNQCSQAKIDYFEYPLLQQLENNFCQPTNNNFKTPYASTDLAYQDIPDYNKQENNNQFEQQNEQFVTSNYPAYCNLQALSIDHHTEEMQQQMTVINLSTQNQNPVETNQTNENEVQEIDFIDCNYIDWDNLEW